MRLLKILVLGCLLVAPSHGQDIPLKTLPVLDGNQFDLYPSEWGSQSFTLEDRLLDPFRNPALGAKTGHHHVTTRPTLYRMGNKDIVSGERAGWTLPIAAGYAGERWFGNVMVAGQQLRFPQAFQYGRNRPSDSNTRENLYAAANVGTSFAKGRLNLGVGFEGRVLTGLEGYDQMNHNSIDYDFGGHHYRIVAGSQFFTGQAHEASALISYDQRRLGQTHMARHTQVGQSDVFDIIAAEGTYKYALDEHWQIAFQTRAQRHFNGLTPVSSSQIPYSQFSADLYRIGTGISRSASRLTWSADVAYEPGGTTVRNHAAENDLRGPSKFSFRSHNAFVRTGLHLDVAAATIHSGTRLRLYHVSDDREGEWNYRHWNEILLTAGISFDLGDAILSYRASVDSGPFARGGSTRFEFPPHVSGGDHIIDDPSFSPSSHDYTHNHQLQLTFPIGR